VDLEGYSPLDNFITQSEKDTIESNQNSWQYFSLELEQKKISQQKKSPANSFYTIQVLISDNLLMIDSLKSTLKTLIPELKQNILYDPPFYKFRVGEFQTKNQANKFLNILEKNGYITSRIVSDKRR